MSLRTDWQTDIAAVTKDALDILGDTVSYTNLSGTQRTGLTARPYAEQREETEYMGTVSEVVKRRFDIPKQTNFPESGGINIGDSVVFDSKTYRVDSFRDVSGGYEALWALECTRTLPRHAGV